MITKAASEIQYSDDSGVSHAVRIDTDAETIEVEAHSSVATFELDKLDWLINALTEIRKVIQ